MQPPSAAEHRGSLEKGASAVPEVFVGLKEGDRHLIILDEKQNLVSEWRILLLRAPTGDTYTCNAYPALTSTTVRQAHS